jgi:hypothetical protein
VPKFSIFPKILIASLLFSLVFSLIWLQPAYADIGPKPEMQFEFSFPEGNPLTILQGSLLECDQPDCQDAQPLEELGPQRFTCGATSCQAMAYGFKPYHRLTITFSDGETRQSNVFSKRFFSANYQVEVRQSDLLVEERLGGINPFSFIFVVSVAGAVCASLLLVAVFVLLVVFFVREDQEKNTFAQSRTFYLLAWLLSIPLIGAGAYFDLALPLTEAIECLLVLGYTHFRKKPRLEGFTIVLLMNLLTQPPLWFALNSSSAHHSWLVFAIAEGFIWLFESVIFYLTQRRSYTFKEATAVCLMLNGLSLTIGLLLPL